MPRKIREAPPRAGERARCRNCPTIFIKRTDHQEFCSPACRKQFWKHGGISYARIRQAVQDEMREHHTALAKEIAPMVIGAMTAPLCQQIQAEVARQLAKEKARATA